MAEVHGNEENEHLPQDTDRLEQGNRQLNNQPEEKGDETPSKMGKIEQLESELKILRRLYLDLFYKEKLQMRKLQNLLRSQAANDNELKSEEDKPTKRNEAIIKEKLEVVFKEAKPLEEIPKHAEKAEIKELPQDADRLEPNERGDEKSTLEKRLLQKDHVIMEKTGEIGKLKSRLDVLLSAYIDLFKEEKVEKRRPENVLVGPSSQGANDDKLTREEDKPTKDNETITKEKLEIVLTKSLEEIPKDEKELPQNADRLEQGNRQLNDQPQEKEDDRLKDHEIMVKTGEIAKLKCQLDMLLSAYIDQFKKEKSEQHRPENVLIGQVDRLRKDNKELKSEVARLTEDNEAMKEILSKEKTEIKRLQAKLSNVKTYSSHQNGTIQKLMGDNAALMARNKELQDKHSVTRDTLENYMAEYEEAINKLKENEKEIARLKSDLAENEEKLTRALKCKADLRELKKRLRESELAISLQKEETEQVRKDLDEERHEHRMAQVRAQERGRKIQLLNLELTELKESFEIARNVIDEKETNMKGIKKRLEAEREQKLKLEEKLEIMSHLETKLKYVEEEKHRLERLKDKQELDQSILEQENKRLKDQLKETEDRITSLNTRILQMDQEIGDNRKSIERLESHSDELKLRYWDLWHSCQYDREWWMQRSLKVGCDSGRRCKRAPARRPRRGYQSGGMRSSYRGHLTELPGGNIDHHADDEGLASCAVRNGDRVMIQNKINGEEKTTKGTVRYVAVGANGLTLLMALELD